MKQSQNLENTNIPDTDQYSSIIPRSRDDITIKNLSRLAVYVLGVVTVIWHIYYSWKIPVSRTEHMNIHLALLLPVFYLMTCDFEPDSWRDKYRNLLSILFLAATVVSTIYIHLNFERWQGAGRLLRYTNVDVLIGLLIIAVTIHATWRAFGKVISLVVIGSMFYGFLGQSIPSSLARGIFTHSGFSLERLIVINSVTLDGVFGNILAVGATWVVIFILFAGVIEAYGGIDYIIQMGKKSQKIVSSGVMQSAVVSSMIMGSLSGAAAANVATTGSFTIPLMKSEGVDSRMAASIESIASTGGQILPPVMGSAAFLMADILSIGYYNVIVGAVLPALLFYITVAIVVHLEALRGGWAVSREDIEEETDSRSLMDHLIETIPYTLALFALIYMLIVTRTDPLTAGRNSIGIIVAVAFVRDLFMFGLSLDTVGDWIRRTIEGCKIGAENMAPLTAVLASLGIVINILVRTGFPQRFTLQILALAGGVFALVLILVMLASIVFGMGMPTPAAYLVVAVLTAPAIVRLGIEPLTAHMFVFYFALLSTITPPVAVTCAVAAGVARTDFLGVCYETLRLGLFAFLTPFVFVINEDLIVWSSTTPITFAITSLGFISMAVALAGFDLRKSIPLWQRAVYFTTAIALFFLPVVVFRYGIAVALLVWIAYLLASSEVDAIPTRVKSD